KLLLSEYTIFHDDKKINRTTKKSTDCINRQSTQKSFVIWQQVDQAILRKSSVSVEIEVRPRQLVPDTNCFIDYLPQLQCITKAISGAQPFFTLMVPLVVGSHFAISEGLNFLITNNCILYSARKSARLFDSTLTSSFAYSNTHE
ncbi:hypothetical protein PV326_006234, partial [Microctonus aethiopoides]